MAMPVGLGRQPRPAGSDASRPATRSITSGILLPRGTTVASSSMAGEGAPHKPSKFSVYQNPTFSAALTASSIRPSIVSFILMSSVLIASVAVLLALSSRKSWAPIVALRFDVSMVVADSFIKSLSMFVGLLIIATLWALVRAFYLRSSGVDSAKWKEQQKGLTDRQLNLLGLKPKSPEKNDAETIKSPMLSRPVLSEPIVLVRKSPLSCPPSGPSRIGYDQKSISAEKKKAASSASLPSVAPHSQDSISPSTSWSKGSAKGIQTEEMLEKLLAAVDEKLSESAVKEASQMTPPPTIRGIGITSPSSFTSSATPSGATRSTPLRPVRMSPSSHQKYTTPPKKGEGEIPPPMSMEQLVEAFEGIGIYPHIELWRDRLRQWFSSVLINPLLKKIETSHIQVMNTASNLGISVTVSQVGSDTPQSALPVAMYPAAKEWQPTISLDEDGFLHQLHATLQQAHLRSASQVPMVGMQSPQQNPLLALIQACMDAITEHQKLGTLMKGELIKGLLPQSSVRADYTVQRVRELAVGTCLKNYDYLGNGTICDKADNKTQAGELPTDSHLLWYLFCAFLEHPKWMLHVDPASYSGFQSSKTPLFLGVLPPKERFPEKYAAVISGVPYVIHPGACVLAIGKQRPPTCALYWDKKLQFSMQGRTALWDSILLLCHMIEADYGGIIRGVHLRSPALDIFRVLDPDTDG